MAQGERRREGERELPQNLLAVGSEKPVGDDWKYPIGGISIDPDTGEALNPEQQSLLDLQEEEERKKERKWYEPLDQFPAYGAGLLAAGASMMRQSGWRDVPITRDEMIGHAIPAGMEAYYNQKIMNRQDDALDQQQRAAVAEAEKERDDAETEEEDRAAFIKYLKASGLSEDWVQLYSGMYNTDPKGTWSKLQAHVQGDETAEGKAEKTKERRAAFKSLLKDSTLSKREQARYLELYWDNPDKAWDKLELFLKDKRTPGDVAPQYHQKNDILTDTTLEHLKKYTDSMTDDQWLEVKKDGIKILTSDMQALPAAEKDKDQWEILTKEDKQKEELDVNSIYKRNKTTRDVELVQSPNSQMNQFLKKKVEKIVEGDWIKTKTTYQNGEWEITAMTPFTAKTEYKTYSKEEKIAIDANPDAIIQEATAGPDKGKLFILSQGTKIPYFSKSKLLSADVTKDLGLTGRWMKNDDTGVYTRIEEDEPYERLDRTAIKRWIETDVNGYSKEIVRWQHLVTKDEWDDIVAITGPDSKDSSGDLTPEQARSSADAIYAVLKTNRWVNQEILEANNAPTDQPTRLKALMDVLNDLDKDVSSEADEAQKQLMRPYHLQKIQQEVKKGYNVVLASGYTDFPVPDGVHFVSTHKDGLVKFYDEGMNPFVSPEISDDKRQIYKTEVQRLLADANWTSNPDLAAHTAKIQSYLQEGLGLEAKAYEEIQKLIGQELKRDPYRTVKTGAQLNDLYKQEAGHPNYIANGFYRKDEKGAWTLMADKERTERFRTADSLRNEYNLLTRDARVAGLAFKGLVTGVASNSGPGDIMIITSFRRMFEPDSVVREGEYAITESAQGLLQQIRMIAKKFVEGDRLHPSVRRKFLQLGKEYMTGLKKYYQQQTDNYREIAVRQGLSLKDATLNISTPLHDLDLNIGILAMDEAADKKFFSGSPSTGEYADHAKQLNNL